jgi:hypothetical protein
MNVYHTFCSTMLPLALLALGCSGAPPADEQVCKAGKPEACLCSSDPVDVGVRYCRGDGLDWGACACESEIEEGPGPDAGTDSCERILPAVACGASACGIRSDGCGGAYNCGTSVWPLCAGTDEVCIFSPKTPGVCASVSECVHIIEHDDVCGAGQELVVCNQSEGYSPGACQLGSGACAPYDGPTLDIGVVPAMRLSCCTPCAL